MAQFAPVAPIQILEEMKARGILGKYHLLLAHHVLEFPERFAALFDSVALQCTIIMDNSIVELGASENEDKVMDAVMALGGAESEHWIVPVLTDVMGDGAATREAATKSYDWWVSHKWCPPLMVVAQGKDWGDFTKTVDHFLLDPNYGMISYVGVPRKLVETLGTRQLAIQYIEAVRPDISVHLLGFSDDVTDDVICANHASVEGIDSAVPIRYSYGPEEKPLYTPTAEIPPRPKDWFEKGVYEDAIERNLSNIRKWVA